MLEGMVSKNRRATRRGGVAFSCRLCWDCCRVVDGGSCSDAGIASPGRSECSKLQYVAALSRKAKENGEEARQHRCFQGFVDAFKHAPVWCVVRGCV